MSDEKFWITDAKRVRKPKLPKKRLLKKRGKRK